MAEKQVRFTVDGTQAESYMQRMRQSASGLAREMITASEGMGKTGRDVLKDVEDQIKAIEKRNSLYLDIQKRELAANLGSDKLSQTDYDKGISNLGSDSDEDRTQTQLLRELIDTVKTTAKTEVREDREGVKDQVDAFRRGDAVDEDEFSRLKMLLQGDEFGGEDDGTSSRRGSKESGGFDPRFIPGVLGAQNAGDLAQQGAGGATSMFSKMGKAGVVGLIVSLVGGAVVKTLLQSTGELEQSAQDYAVLTRQPIATAMGSARDVVSPELSALGMTPSDYFQKNAKYTRALMSGGVDTFDLVGLEEGRGVSEAGILELLGVERYSGNFKYESGEKVNTTDRVASYFEKYLQRTGQHIAVLPEILSQFAQEAKVIIGTQGEVNSSSLAATITGIGTAFGVKGENLSRVVGGIRGGMQRQQNPVIQALQFESMSQVTPGASLWDLEVAMEDPLENPGYINQYLTNLRKMSGGGDMYKRAIFNTFGQYGISKRDAERIAEGSGDLMEIMRSSIGFGDSIGRTGIIANPIIDYSKVGQDYVGALRESTAIFKGLKSSLGIEKTQILIEKLNIAMGKLMRSVDKDKDKDKDKTPTPPPNSSQNNQPGNRKDTI